MGVGVLGFKLFHFVPLTVLLMFLILVQYFVYVFRVFNHSILYVYCSGVLPQCIGANAVGHVFHVRVLSSHSTACVVIVGHIYFCSDVFFSFLIFFSFVN